MKNKKLLVLLLFCVFIYLFIFSSVSFADNEDLTPYSTHCILIEASTGKVLYEKDAYSMTYPASTTKIMTAILALENCSLTDVATVSHNAIYSVPIGYSHAYLVEGEELTINQLLHILLIPSANDAAIVLAEHIAGSVQSFATMMNTKALEIGCRNTNFVNPNGIHNQNHYSTAYDLALIGRYAMKNEVFRKIVTKSTYTLPATNKYATSDRFFKQTNSLVVPNSSDNVGNYYYKYATGIKTGYTEAAGDCVVASAQKDGIQYIVVILGGQRTENGLDGRFIDCKNLFNYAFENYTTYKVNDANSFLKELKVSKANLFAPNLSIDVQDEITLVLEKDTNISSITPTINISSDLKTPIKKNSIVGTISYTVDGNTYTSNLIAGNDVEEFNLFTSILTIISVILIFVLISTLLKIGKKKNKKKKKKGSTKSKEHDSYLYW